MHSWNGKLYLVTPEEFKLLPDGFKLKCIDGKHYVKGKDYIDDDTRFGHLAFGSTKNQLKKYIK